MTTTTTASAVPHRILLQIAPFALIIFLGYLSIGLPFGALALRVHDALGFSDLIVGIVIGAQSLATLLTRQYAGSLCDRVGPKTSVLRGAAISALAGMIYQLSTIGPLGAGGSLAVLLAGRATLGLGESLLVTGALAWAITTVGPQHTGKVMVWVGIGMYAAIAAASPFGLYLMTQQHVLDGFMAVAIGTIVFPIVAFALAVTISPVKPAGGTRMPFLQVVARIAPSGLGLALATVGFGAIAAFAALDFQQKGWSGAGFALTAFGAAYIVTRLLLGGLPDTFGGGRIACWSLLIEGAGQAALWLAPSPAVALCGAILTGAGFSLVFPSFGIEAVKRVPAPSRGLALGAYVAFFDIGLGLAGPLTGLVAGTFGYSAAFATGVIGAVLALWPALATMRR